MKKCVIVLAIILLTGCSSKYELKVNGQKLKENISFQINKDKIDYNSNTSFFDPTASLYSFTYIDQFLKTDQQALVNHSNEFYVKKIDDREHYIDVVLSYEYNMSNYQNSNLLATCFDNPEVSFDGDNLYVHLIGRFSCLFDRDGQVEVVISSNNRVLQNNGNRKGLNKYTWIIDKNNSDNVNIEFKVAKESILLYYGIRIIAIIIVIGIILFICSKIGVWMNREEINKI